MTKQEAFRVWCNARNESVRSAPVSDCDAVDDRATHRAYVAEDAAFVEWMSGYNDCEVLFGDARHCNSAADAEVMCPPRPHLRDHADEE